MAARNQQVVGQVVGVEAVARAGVRDHRALAFRGHQHHTRPRRPVGIRRQPGVDTGRPQLLGRRAAAIVVAHPGHQRGPDLRDREPGRHVGRRRAAVEGDARRLSSATTGRPPATACATSGAIRMAVRA